MNSVSEQIDERILRLLGLDDVFDLDYDTYLTLLKEAIVTGANKIPQEELALLANERKRVRGRKGRFKPKKEKITADKIATTKFLKPTKKTLALPASISKPADSPQNLSGFGKPLQSIAKTLSAILKFNKKSKEDERKDKESEKRTKREEGLEGFKKGISAVSGATRKLLAPFQSIIDRIWKFIFFTLLGRAFTQLMEWLGDPKNKRKIEVLGRFLKDWWPTLLGAAVLFFTPFGKFVRTTLKIVGFLTGRLIGSIPKIAGAIKGLSRVLLNPWVAIPAAAVGLAAAANEITGQRKAAPIQAENKARAQTGKGLGVQGIGGVGDMGPTTPYGLLQGAMNGGTVMNGYGGIDKNTGEKVTGFGPDTQAIIAQPGEIVMNKKAVDAVGADNLLALNRQYGGPGANKPKMGRLYNTGGVVGMRGGENIKPTREENLRIASPSRNAWNALDTKKVPLNLAIQEAKDFILDKQAKVNINIDEPWWQKLNPFREKRSFADKLPSTPIEKFRMPGFDLKGWSDLKSFRENKNPYKPNIKNPKIKYAPGDRYLRPGMDKPLMLQGGGEVTSESLEKTYVQGQKSGMSSDILKAIGDEAFLLKNFGVGGTWRNFKGSGASNMRGEPLHRKQGGGLIKENTGMNIPGATADRQLLPITEGGTAALHPGEYVLPKQTVDTLGIPLIDQIVAITDYDSTPAKLGKKPISRPSITPLPRARMGGMMTLPPITQSAAGSSGFVSAAGSKVPSFSTVSPSGGGERSMNASIYGIVG